LQLYFRTSATALGSLGSR